jgi:hypothetical protein
MHVVVATAGVEGGCEKSRSKAPNGQAVIAAGSIAIGAFPSSVIEPFPTAVCLVLGY